MHPDHIAGLLALFERSSLSELEYAEGASRLRLSRAVSPGAAGAFIETFDRPAQSSLPPSATPSADTEVRTVAAPASVKTRTINAGVMGTFFRRPAPGQAPFASVGDVVRDGQTVGIIEAMKMLNAIEADCDGTILEIVAEDGSPVESGAVLFVISPKTNPDSESSHV